MKRILFACGVLLFLGYVSYVYFHCFNVTSFTSPKDCCTHAQIKVMIDNLRCYRTFFCSFDNIKKANVSFEQLSRMLYFGKGHRKGDWTDEVNQMIQEIMVHEKDSNIQKAVGEIYSDAYRMTELE